MGGAGTSGGGILSCEVPLSAVAAAAVVVAIVVVRVCFFVGDDRVCALGFATRT